MKAVVYHDVGDISLDDVPEPTIRDPNDALVRITGSGICGTDLHMIRGTMPGMEDGTILGHEAVGIVEEVGSNVRNFKPGDRVVIPSTIACGYCSYCRAGYFSQCDNANPNGPHAGTAFFGGPKMTGSFDGLQAEMARVPFANVGLVKIPDSVTDEQALMLSDIFPTGYFGADMAHIHPGHTVSVFGCGPVGQFAIISAFLMGAGRVLAVDCIESRLDRARDNGAEIINFEQENAVDTIMELTGGIGTDRAIDAVGVDAMHPHSTPATAISEQQQQQFDEEVQEIAPERFAGEKEGKQLASGRCAVAGPAMGGAVHRQGRDDRDHRCLSGEHAVLPHRPGDEQEPHDPHGQLPASPVHSGADGNRLRRRRSSRSGSSPRNSRSPPPSTPIGCSTSTRRAG